MLLRLLMGTSILLTVGLHVMLQTSTSSITNAVNEAMSDINNMILVPGFQAALTIGGAALLFTIFMVILRFIEHMVHPTSWGRTSALTELINHFKQIVGAAIAIWLIIFLIFFSIPIMSGQVPNPTAAAEVAGKILAAMFTVLGKDLSSVLGSLGI
ncbi:hypothetical protein JCM14467A_07500 [Vulcanisaeta sp. JCM 14467]